MYIYIYIYIYIVICFCLSFLPDEGQSGDRKLEIKYFDQKNAVFTVSIMSIPDRASSIFLQRFTVDDYLMLGGSVTSEYVNFAR